MDLPKHFMKRSTVLFIVLVSVDLMQTFSFLGYESNPVVSQYPELCLSAKVFLISLAFHVFGRVKSHEELRFVSLTLLNLFYLFIVSKNMYTILEILRS